MKLKNLKIKKLIKWPNLIFLGILLSAIVAIAWFITSQVILYNEDQKKFFEQFNGPEYLITVKYIDNFGSSQSLSYYENTKYEPDNINFKYHIIPELESDEGTPQLHFHCGMRSYSRIVFAQEIINVDYNKVK